MERTITRGKLQQTRECLDAIKVFRVYCVHVQEVGGWSFTRVGTGLLAKTTARVLDASRNAGEKNQTERWLSAV